MVELACYIFLIHMSSESDLSMRRSWNSFSGVTRGVIRPVSRAKKLNPQNSKMILKTYSVVLVPA